MTSHTSTRAITLAAHVAMRTSAKLVQDKDVYSTHVHNTSDAYHKANFCLASADRILVQVRFGGAEYKTKRVTWTPTYRGLEPPPAWQQSGPGPTERENKVYLKKKKKKKNLQTAKWPPGG